MKKIRADSTNNASFGQDDQPVDAYNPNVAMFINWPASYHGSEGALNLADGIPKSTRGVIHAAFLRSANKLTHCTEPPARKTVTIEWPLRHATVRK